MEKLDSFFNREYHRGTSDIAIIQTGDNSYELFDKYTITKDKSEFIVVKSTAQVTKKFFSLKHAVTWCIFDFRNKINETFRIEELDRSLSSILYSIDLHRHLINKTKDTDNKLLYFAKLTDEELKKKSILKEISFFINTSKKYQLEQFAKKHQN